MAQAIILLNMAKSILERDSDPRAPFDRVSIIVLSSLARIWLRTRSALPGAYR
jgi:hypothetical protein